MNQPLRLEYVDPATLTANPANWRIHPPEQRAAIRALIGEVGWAEALLFNERTGRLLNGHMRAEEYAGQVVPVLFGSWDERQEAKILATLDPVGMMAEIDGPAFASLLREVDAGAAELQELLAAVAESAGMFAPMDLLRPEGESPEAATADGQAEPEDAEEEDRPAFAPADVPDAVWPSDNPFGIPTLDPRMQADAFDFPVTVWGTQARGKPMKGTWLFYTADRKFEAVWKSPGDPLLSSPVVVVEPNFSTHPEHPRAHALWNVYRKRWLARWWQSKGFRVAVDLNVDAAFRSDNLLGVPKGWRAYATRSHSGGAYLESEFATAREHAGTDDVLFLVYGGGDEARRLSQARGWKWVPEHSDVARDPRFGKKVRRTLSRNRKGAP